MTRPTAQIHARPGSEPAIYCLISPELLELRDVLAHYFADDPDVDVVVERRRRPRRSGGDRRRSADDPPHGVERRLARDLEGRRFGERRTALVPVEEPPPLPPEVRRYVGELSFVKPVEPPTRKRELARLKAVAAGWRREAKENLRRSQTGGMEALFAALAARDRYTWEHSAAVVWLAVACAREMGLTEDEVAEVHEVALLHDIGKLGIPDAMLSKKAPLSDAEWETMRQHPVIGARIIESIDTLRHLAPAIRAEHERWDGLGYPDGLAGEEIPIASRIAFVCDAYHAMISDRPYREALSLPAARRELTENAGSQFCPAAVETLLAVLDGANIA